MLVRIRVLVVGIDAAARRLTRSILLKADRVKVAVSLVMLLRLVLLPVLPLLSHPFFIVAVVILLVVVVVVVVVMPLRLDQ